MLQNFRNIIFPITKNLKFLYFSFSILFFSYGVSAQQITGVWKGKIDRQNVEVKIIKNGDSLTGTSYYYESPNSYRRYTIKGFFDERDNSVVWWDDQLIEEHKGKRLLPAKAPAAYLNRADFNCPGGTKMYLSGKALLKDTEQERGPVDLQKYPNAVFNDEWNFVIDNYTVGANDPELIDSIGNIAFQKPIRIVEKPIITEKNPDRETVAAKPTPPAPPAAPVFISEKEQEPKTVFVPQKPKEIIVAKAPLGIKDKFANRKTLMQKEIPLSGDSIALSFYDNAEVDGDSISIFLNGVLLQEHIRLTDKAYSIMFAVSALQQTNDLVMVAENLGSIPPNTSFMVAMVDGKRYEARLESTEKSSAAIRFVKIAKAEDHFF